MCAAPPLTERRTDEVAAGRVRASPRIARRVWGDRWLASRRRDELVGVNAVNAYRPWRRRMLFPTSGRGGRPQQREMAVWAKCLLCRPDACPTRASEVAVMHVAGA